MQRYVYQFGGTAVVIICLLALGFVLVSLASLGSGSGAALESRPDSTTELEELEADKLTFGPDDLAGISELELEADKLQVDFVPGEEGIVLGEELQAEANGERLHIFHPAGNPPTKALKVVIGGAKEYTAINISGEEAVVRGAVTTEKFSLNNAGIKANLDLTADQLEANGAGIDFTGRLQVREILFNGAGIKMDLEVEAAELIEMNGIGVNGRVKYLDRWSGPRRLETNSMGANLDVYIPKNNEGGINIEDNGLGATKVNYY